MIVVATIVLLIIGYITARLMEHEKPMIAGALVGVTLLFATFVEAGVSYVTQHSYFDGRYNCFRRY